ncbi:MAG: S-layer homology domain-containing protein [Muribaculaceae bacterium]|nr:S-layer homology domain-containing protein [Muribaculaceae bacterium]
MKKLLASLMVCGMLSVVAPAFAYQGIDDVSQNYWAQVEIASVVNDSVMSLTGANFNPEGKISRVDFVRALLKVLGNEDLEITSKVRFSDVAKSSDIYGPIARSQQLGLVYGYPNGTFQPAKSVLRDEAQSVISHITIEAAVDDNIVSKYSDAAKVPAWAKHVYAKTLSYGIFVNHPDENELRPTEELTRAEAAVLLYRLRQKLDLVKAQYKNVEETVLGTEHLNVTKKAPCNEVLVTNLRSVVKEGNVLEVEFSEAFKSKLHAAGDAVSFTNSEDIGTKEGTVVFPAGSIFSGSVLDIKDPQWFNKNARVYVQLDKVTTPDGQVSDISAKPFSKDYSLKEGPWMTAGKVALYTVGGAAVGIGSGVGLSFIPDPDKVGKGMAIGAPVGSAVGLITGFVTPGLNYSAKKGEEVKVILTKDASINKECSKL